MQFYKTTKAPHYYATMDWPNPADHKGKEKIYKHISSSKKSGLKKSIAYETSRFK